MKCKQFSSKVHLSLRFKWKNRPQKLQKSSKLKNPKFCKDGNGNYIMDFLRQIFIT